MIDAFGPNRPLIALSTAAVRLHQTSHSSIVQHFHMVKVGRADRAAVRRNRSILAASAKGLEDRAGNRSFTSPNTKGSNAQKSSLKGVSGSCERRPALRFRTA